MKASIGAAVRKGSLPPMDPAGDPTEEYSLDCFAVNSAHESELGRELEAKHGRIEWLHGPSLQPASFPPDPDAFV